MDPGFESAFEFVIGVEGGLSNHPDDPGGMTRYGISQRAYPQVDIAKLTLEQAKNIYLNDYWLAAGCHQLKPRMALLVFDCAVNHGLTRAREWLTAYPDPLSFLSARLDYYTRLEPWPTFGKGWTRRMSKLTQAMSELEPPSPDTVTLPVLTEDNRELGRVTVYPGRKVYVSDSLRRNLRGLL